MTNRTIVEITSQEALVSKLAEIIAVGTLYSPFAYIGQGLHHDRPSEYGVNRFAILPEQLKLPCSHPKCLADQWWQIGYNEGPFYFGHQGPQRITYTCRNCGEAQQYYWISWIELQAPDKDTQSGQFTKVGQWPPLSIELSRDLAKSLGKEDAKLYKKALISASISHGLAALAYFRRVVENKVNSIIDLILESAKNAEYGEVDRKQLEEIKASTYVDQKISLAKKLLPAHLRPGGHNPLDTLYGVASAGLHGESEERCLELFAEYRTSFEYLFRNLTVGNEEALEFLKQMSSPTPKHAQRTKADRTT